MNKCMKLAALALVAGSIPTIGFAQLSIPDADGSDGALNISSNTVIDLSQAVTGSWTNTSASPGKGTYDPAQWAVVFKYSSVIIASNATVTFKNHPTHAPVVWLVSGDVTINGELNLDGQNPNSSDPLNLSEPGPGGFRGGATAQAGINFGGGFGIGGYFNDNGSYATHNAYGNPQIVPLIGGSGGSGSGNCGVNYNGGAGGGAILIAADGTTTINGYCHANDYLSTGCGSSYYGSGGAIRLIANQILGNGKIEATSYNPGRIRLEANTASTALNVNPATVAVAPSPLVIWPATNAATVRVVSVASLPAPADPSAKMSAASDDDLTLTTTNVVAVVLQTSNFPTNGTVNVYIKPRNNPQSIFQAAYVSGNTNQATWQVNTSLPVGHAVIQARAVY